MSKLKSTTFGKSRVKVKNPIPYDVEIYKKSNNCVDGLSVTNVDLPPVGNYITPRDRAEISLTTTRWLTNGSDEQTFSMQKHQSEFFKTIRELWKQGKMCDVVLSVEKTTFRVHKIALAACSEHFRDLFVGKEKSSTTTDLLRIPLLGIKSDIIEKIIDGIYSAKITLNSASVGDILSAAAYLRMPSIVESCQAFLSKRLGVDNCLKTLQIAHLYNLEKLKELAYATASANFKIVSHQKDFSKLRYYELLSMLPRQDLVIDSEMQIFNAILRWTEVEKSTRLPYVGRLMRHVRFPLMTESQLVDHVEGSNIASEVPEVGELVREAVRYHLLPHRRSILQNSRTIPRTTFETKAVIASGGLPGKGHGSSIGRIFYYDDKSNTWAPLADMPEPRHHHAAIVLGGFLYIAGGDQGRGVMESSKKVWRYDSWTEEWLQVASMLEARQSFQLGVLDHRIYAVGGRVGKEKTLSDVERYNPSTNTWSTIEAISSPRRYVSLATLSGRLYAVGGSGSDLISRRVERYNPVSSKWERRQPLSKPRFSAFLHPAKNRLWLIGGATVNDNDPTKRVVATSEIEVYSPALDQWTVIGGNETRITKEIACVGEGGERESDAEKLIQTCRTEAGSCMLGDDIYLVAGYSWDKKDRLSDVERISLSQLTPYFPKYTTVKAQEKGALCGTEDLLKNIGERKYSTPKPADYPLPCTGVACAALTLHKKPNFVVRDDEMTFLQMPGPNQHIEDQKSSLLHSKNAPILAFREIPKTAAGGLHSATNEISDTREQSIEKGLQVLTGIGFPDSEIPQSSPPRRVRTANQRTISLRLCSDARTRVISPAATEIDPEDVVVVESPSPDISTEQSEVDVELDKMMSFVMDDWDDRPAKDSTPAVEFGEVREGPDIQEESIQTTKVFMTQ